MTGDAGRLPVCYVDDEPDNLKLFRLHFQDRFEIITAPSAEDALRILSTREVGVLLADERMPGMRGIDLLAHVLERWPDVIRIIVSAYTDGARLLGALNRGHAHEYVVKPWHRDELLGCVERALEMAQRRRVLRAKADLADALLEQCDEGPPDSGFVGTCASTSSLRALMARAAESDATVLILGETGTGKEVVARAIHRASDRAGGPFIALNCAAIPESLVESELFGHEQGAFTGASKARKGRFELAHGGSLFLDEIGDVSPRVQIALLRVLQERTVERIGSDRRIPLDVRVMAATHRDLPAMVREGAFREDLYYRLNVIALHVPPLRERADDIPELVRHFMEKWRHARPSRRMPRLATGVIPMLGTYSWPGNVRELENMVQRALVMCDGETVTIDDFTFSVLPAPSLPPSEPSVRELAQHTEASKLRELLLAHGGNCSRAARALGVPRTTLVSRAKKLGLF